MLISLLFIPSTWWWSSKLFSQNSANLLCESNHHFSLICSINSLYFRGVEVVQQNFNLFSLTDHKHIQSGGLGNQFVAASLLLWGLSYFKVWCYISSTFSQNPWLKLIETLRNYNTIKFQYQNKRNETSLGNQTMACCFLSSFYVVIILRRLIHFPYYLNNNELGQANGEHKIFWQIARM